MGNVIQEDDTEEEIRSKTLFHRMKKRVYLVKLAGKHIDETQAEAYLRKRLLLSI